MAEKPPMTDSSTSAKIPEAGQQAPGEGIRSLKTSSLFRAVNFELYAKPVKLFVEKPFQIKLILLIFQNKYMIIFGIGAATFTFGYLIYMREKWRKQKVYTAINDDDELVVTKKASRWD